MTNSARTTFSLNGPSIQLDAGTHAVRGDLADIALAGKLFVPHYAQPMQMDCIVDDAGVFAEADRDSEALGPLSKGDSFMVVDLSGGWAWGFRASDHIVGYVDASALAPAK